MTNRIVVGLDGSEHSADALRWGAQVAEARGWPLVAATTWGYLDQRHPGGEARFESAYTDADARAALASYVEAALGAERAATVVQEAVNDLPAQGLCALAGPDDLLVLGARGRGGLRSLLLGSVSTACLHHSRGPVAIIRSGTVAGDGAGAGGGDPRVVAGIDGSAESEAALRWAAEHAAATGARLDVVHAWRAPAVAGAALAYAPVDPTVFRDGAREVLDRAVAAIADVPLAAPPTPVLVEDRAAAALLDRAGGAALLVVGARGLGGFTGLLLGSVSDQLARHAPCPVVVVRTAG